MAGPREVDLRDLRLDRPGIHALLPVGVVAVGHRERDRAAQRAPVAHARRHLGAVALDLHATAAAVAQLAPRQVAVELVLVQLQARGQALDDAGQAWAVGFAGCDQAQHGAASLEEGHCSPPRRGPLQTQPQRLKRELR